MASVMLFQLFIVFIIVNGAASQFHKLVRMNTSMLQTWYDRLPLCMIANATSSNVSYWTTLESCKKDIPHYMFADGFGGLPSSAFANKVRGTCCTEDVAVSDRGFDEVVEGFEDGNAKPVTKLLNELSAKNRSLLFMGDSMNTQVFAAFIDEMNREQSGGIYIGNAFDDRWYSYSTGRYTELGLTKKDMMYILNCGIWTPNNSSGYTNPVFIYNVNMYFFSMAHHEEFMVSRVLLPFLATHEHPSGLVILANIGHHLASERSHGDKTVINTRVGSFLTWLHDLVIVNPKNVVAFRETTPSHFNSPDLDGSYEKWHSSRNAHYDYLDVNNWDRSLYYCREIFNLSNPRVSQTPENMAARDILAAWGNSSLISILPVFEYLAPFYKMKYGHCGGYNRINIIDCVHFCSNSPPMWIPVWFSILNLVKSHKEHPQSTESISWEIRNQWAYAIPIIEALPIGAAAPPRIYIIRNGLKHMVESWLDLQRAMNETLSNSTARTMTTAELNDIPEGVPVKLPKVYPDGTWVRVSVSVLHAWVSLGSNARVENCILNTSNSFIHPFLALIFILYKYLHVIFMHYISLFSTAAALNNKKELWLSWVDQEKYFM